MRNRGTWSRSHARAMLMRGRPGRTGPCRAAFTGAAFLASGTTQMISRDFRIWRTDIEIAIRAPGKSTRTILRRPAGHGHASSSWTMM